MEVNTPKFVKEPAHAVAENMHMLTFWKELAILEREYMHMPTFLKDHAHIVAERKYAHASISERPCSCRCREKICTC